MLFVATSCFSCCLILSMPLTSLEKRQVVSVWCEITNHEAVLDIEFIVISFFRFFSSKVYVEEMERHHFSSCQFQPLFLQTISQGELENKPLMNISWNFNATSVTIFNFNLMHSEVRNRSLFLRKMQKPLSKVIIQNFNYFVIL